VFESELRNLMYTAQLQKDKPFTIRYPRGQGVLVNWKTPFKKIKIGKGRKVSSGKDLAILTRYFSSLTYFYFFKRSFPIY
jgi:1-deoxy-D-xylulose-5-phosphate synthase